MNYQNQIDTHEERLLELIKEVEAEKNIIAGLKTLNKIHNKEKLSSNVRKTIVGEDDEEGAVRKGLPFGRMVRELIENRGILSLPEIYQALAEKYDVKVGTSARMKINQALSNLKVNQILKSIDKFGKKNRIYGLKEWFDESGNIKPKHDRPSLTPVIQCEP